MSVILRLRYGRVPAALGLLMLSMALATVHGGCAEPRPEKSPDSSRAPGVEPSSVSTAPAVSVPPSDRAPVDPAPSPDRPSADPAPPSDRSSAEVAVSLFLIGDGGSPAASGESVLQALSRQIESRPGRVVVAILGDNIYPLGLPEPTVAYRLVMERRLRMQLDAAIVADAEVIVVPGNHDWQKGREGGWESILRQQEYVDRNYGDRVRWLPRDGCPGPAIVDVGADLRLVVLDTQWFLHSGPRPQGPDSGCAASTAEESMTRLKAALAAAGRRQVVVLGHHPLRSAGRHGGYFPWQDHLFPLRNLRSWLWLPLPGVGSLYPLVRKLGVSPQDQSSRVYRRLVAGLTDAFHRHPPLLYAAGHEHHLEVLAGDEPPWVVVSGAARIDEITPVGRREDAVYLAERAGFVRVDFLSDGHVGLEVLTVDVTGKATSAFSTALTGRW